MTSLRLLKQSQDVRVGTNIAYVPHQLEKEFLLSRCGYLEQFTPNFVWHCYVASIIFQILRFHLKSWFALLQTFLVVIKVRGKAQH